MCCAPPAADEAREPPPRERERLEQPSQSPRIAAATSASRSSEPFARIGRRPDLDFVVHALVAFADGDLQDRSELAAATPQSASYEDERMAASQSSGEWRDLHSWLARTRSGVRTTKASSS